MSKVGWLTYLKVAVSAIRLVRVAQRLRRQSINAVLAALASQGRPGLDVDVDADVVGAVVQRVSRVFGALPGAIDTCLVRSLVAGVLLAERRHVVLHIGFVGSGGSMLDGHAWVTANGVPVSLGDDPVQNQRFETILDKPIFEEWTIGSQSD